MKIYPKFKLTLSEISNAVGAPVQKSDAEINAIVTNSKEASVGDLFIALDGESTSGENFTDFAARAGAFILSKKDSADIKVRDTGAALLSLAAYYKSKLKGIKYTVAITGSVGKTTTKNLLSKILSQHFCVHSTYGNYNNFLGVSHTLLTAPPETEILIIEMGMNHIGEISELSKAVSPNIAVITNVGSAHIGNLGSKERIAKAKLEILDGMQQPLLISPEDEKLLEKIDERYTYSVNQKGADCFLRCVAENTSTSVFDIYTEKQSIKNLHIRIPGKHILSSVAICAAVIENMGLSLDILSETLPEITEDDVVRAKLRKFGIYTVYDDTYSASVEATLANLELIANRYEKVSCVLGDMLELGEKTKELHIKVGAAVALYGFHKLFTFGKSAAYIADGALANGMSKDKIFINDDLSTPKITADQIKSNCESDEILLVKASHATHAERIFPYLEK